MFSWLWTRKGPDGQPQPMQTWELLYWGVGVFGISAFLLSRSSWMARKEDDGVSMRGGRWLMHTGLRRVQCQPSCAQAAAIEYVLRLRVVSVLPHWTDGR